MRDIYRFWCGILREREHLENTDLNEKIILKRIFRECNDEHGLD
jgi:hypothetical protein